MFKIQHTKRFVLLGAAGLVAWMSAVTMFLEGETWKDVPAPAAVEGTLNLSLLFAMVLFIWCLVRLFREWPLLQAGEKGLYIRLSRKTRGIVPWRAIAQFELSSDGRTVNLYLQGMWDFRDDCGERFEIQAGEAGRRRIPLRLRGKVSSVKRTAETLEQWRLSFDGSQPHSAFPELDEAALRRIAVRKKSGLSVLLTLLYFLRSKYWVLMLLLFLLTAGCLTEYTPLTVLWALALSLVPFLILAWLLRKLLRHGISALERRKVNLGNCSIGL